MKGVLQAAAFCAAICASAFAEGPVQLRVSIKSQPEGATVIVDGRDRGTTPTVLFDLEPGRHHIKYRLAGYQEKDRFFDTKDGPFIEKSEVLEEEKGLLLLKTDPPGCNISIDGVSAGVTPRLVTGLAAKDAYSVKFTKTGYLPQTISVKFNGREPLVREETMVLDSGVIHVISDPAGAEVSVNDVVRGATPLLVKGIPKGRATVKFRLAGFRDEVRELVMRPGDQQTLSVALNALPGTLNLVSVPDGASFYVNDKAYGRGPVAIPSLPAGEYTVRAEKDGYGTVTRTVVISSGESAREEFRLSNVMGRLEVRSLPPGAQIFLDGRMVGKTTSSGQGEKFSDAFVVDNILEGEHLLVLKKDGYAQAVRHPNIKNSKTSQQNVRLRRVFVPDIEIETVRGSYRGMFVTATPEYIEIEVSLGIVQRFMKSEIRKMNPLGGRK